MPDLDFAVKYPFSSDAKEAISDIEITDEIAEKATQLILSAMSGNLGAKDYRNDDERREDIAAYAFARMILGAMRNRFLTSKFAVAISKSARRSMNYDDSENVKKLIAEFGIRVRADGRVFIVDYLRFSPKDPHYSLFNRTFSNGWVQASEDEKKRLVEEAVRKHVENIPIVKNPSEQIKGIMARIDKELPKTEKKIMIKPGEYPPCIVHLLEEIRKHHNLPHHARWFLAVYLIEAGLKDDAIVAIYSNLPDFEEKKTRYQIEHARKRGYSIPSCATIASYGICTTECKVGSPVNWRRRR